MNRYLLKVHFIVMGIGFLLLGGLAGASASQRVTFTRSQLLMGHIPVTISVKIGEKEQAKALAAMNQAYALAKVLEGKISEYQASSEISCLNRQREPCPLSPEVYDLLVQALQLNEKTGGAFDIRFASPSLQARRAPIELKKENQTARLSHAHTRVGMASLGKGFVVDRMIETLNQAGFAEVLVDAAGDLRASGGPWDVAIQIPGAANGVSTPAVAIFDEAWASAGNYEKGRHIIDPRTLEKVDRRGSVTVRAKHLSLANALATACFVLGPEASKKIAAAFPEARIIWTDSSGESERHAISNEGGPIGYAGHINPHK